MKKIPYNEKNPIDLTIDLTMKKNFIYLPIDLTIGLTIDVYYRSQWIDIC